LGYGTYSVSIDSNLNVLPDSIVTGFFVYSDPQHEVDFIEHSNGVVVGKPKSFQYVIQPYGVPGHREQFSAPDEKMTHVATWMPSMVSFASYTSLPDENITAEFKLESSGRVSFDFLYIDNVDKAFIKRPGSTVLKDFWTGLDARFYRARVSQFYPYPTDTAVHYKTLDPRMPKSNGERLHLNMWLFNGEAPGPQSQTYEVVISDISFKPFPAEYNPKLKILKVSNNETDVEVSLP
jgi:hypothetical protein